MTTDKKENLFAYIKPINKKFLLKQSLKTNHTLSEYADGLIDSLRLKRDFKLPERTLKAQEKINQTQDRKRRQIKALEDKYRTK